jgi:YidC/Oxa1 family membrane protein insertase
MADTVNGNNNPATPHKEMSMEIRLLLAFLLMGAVMFLTPYLMKTYAPPAAKKGQTASTAQTTPPAAPGQTPQAEQAVVAEAKPADRKRAAEPAPGATPQIPLPPLEIDTGTFRIAFSNQGATVRSWQLKKLKGNDDKPLELMNTAAGLEFPFSLHFPSQQPTSKVNWAYYLQTPDPDGLGVKYEFSDGHTTVRKVFRFQKDSYISQVSTEVTLDGNPIPNMIAWRGGFGDLTVANPAASSRALYFNVTANKLVEQTVSAAKNGPVTSTGNYSFAGLADAYFAAVFLPRGTAPMQEITFADSVRTALDQTTRQLPGVAVSDGAENRFELFIGPKDLDQLRRINPKLEQLVDFGWIGILAKPLFLITNWFNDTFVHNFGWSIVVVTIVINFVLFPLKLSNMKSMRKMQALKPQIDAINQKYKNIGMRDPRKADQNQEVMALYKQNGVNPMGGCFPMLLQIPFFFAFYKVFTVSVEMRGASWLWVTDLSQPEHLPIKILPIVMIASQFFMQKMTPQANADPSQQKMMMFMPLVFGFMFYNFPSGLVLYYLTSNLVSMGQQLFFNHTEAAVAAARSVETPKKKNGRK